MSEESMEKSALVPRLRFPEFREGREWSGKSLASVLIEHGQKDNGNCQVHSVSVHKGVINQKEHLGRSFAAADTSNYNLAGPHDVIYTKSPTGDFPYGVVKQNRNNFDVIVSPLYGVFRPINKHVGTLIDCYFESPSRAKWFLEPIVQKGAKNTIQISNEVFLSRGIPLPVEPKEQQRIADCLSSLDELITAEAKKLDALKTRKRGLMQQLFPREGEALPRLRFPEFMEAGEWEESRLGDVGSVRMCKRIFKEQTSPRGDIPFYKIGTFGGVPDAYISREIFEDYRNNFPFPKHGAALISAAGTIGRTIRYKGELAYFQDSNIVWLDNDEHLIADSFLFYLYQLINWVPSTGTIQRLYNDNILGTQVKYPSIPEQQKIADCLSSLDDLITAQSKAIETLKTHKMGLMQQLFPVLDEVPA